MNDYYCTFRQRVILRGVSRHGNTVDAPTDAYCTQCGAELAPTAVFCSACGRKKE